MYIYQEKMRLKLFYKKGFCQFIQCFGLRILRCFYIFFWENHAVIGGKLKLAHDFSVLGFDGLLATNGYATFI